MAPAEWSDIVKMYLLSLCAGILVGIVYSLLNVRSPAPPVVALVGLFGILLGEQVVPLVRQVLKGEPVIAACLGQECKNHILGELPGRQAGAAHTHQESQP
jgi:XapX domain-containing protein